MISCVISDYIKIVAGHELEEIRVRALTTILSKLDHGIITVKDLVDKKDIFINLINWFKFQTVPCKKDVLNLILRLVMVCIIKLL